MVLNKYLFLTTFSISIGFYYIYLLLFNWLNTVCTLLFLGGVNPFPSAYRYTYYYGAGCMCGFTAKLCKAFSTLALELGHHVGGEVVGVATTPSRSLAQVECTEYSQLEWRQDHTVLSPETNPTLTSATPQRPVTVAFTSFVYLPLTLVSWWRGRESDRIKFQISNHIPHSWRCSINDTLFCISKTKPICNKFFFLLTNMGVNTRLINH